MVMPLDPAWDAYPKGWANPLNLRVSAALPAAGAWDATPVEQVLAGARQLTLAFSYTRGGAAGAFDWQLEISHFSAAALVPAGGTEWSVADAIYAAGAVVAGADTQSTVQQEYQTYTATAAAKEAFSVGPIIFNGPVERVRINCRESGNVGAPGTLQVTGIGT